jgi:transcriptional regulator with GAF, ATPase, and Fis domain
VEPALSATHLEQILEAFSDTLNCHIEFTNPSGNRIASSSFFRNREAYRPRPIPFNGPVTQQVVQDPKTHVVDRRASSRIGPCASCLYHDTCEIKLEVVSPIITGDRIRGVLAFAAYNNLEAEWLASRLDQFRMINSALAEVISCFLNLAPGSVGLMSECGPELVADSVARPDTLKTSSDPFNKILSVSPQMVMAKESASKIARSDDNLLIVGETGTGKELFARAVHESSSRKNGPFVAVNCASIPESLLESELFGYGPGAFTGANIRGKKGKVEAAIGGTLFLDEIGEMSQQLQAKILRLTQEKAVQKIGETSEKPADIRIISATNKPFSELMTGDVLRRDLFYRLAVHYLELPPLRLRQGDIQFLTNAFLEEAGLSKSALSPLVTKIMSSYHWPGNVRELKNCVIHSATMSAGRTIRVDHLPPWIVESSATRDLAGEHLGTSKRDGRTILRDAEVREIKQALDRFGWAGAGKRKTAEYLNISLSTLYRKIRAYGLDREKTR